MLCLQGGINNVVNMFLYLTETVLQPVGLAPPPPPQETPQTGCLHPNKPGYFFTGPAEYMAWYVALMGCRGDQHAGGHLLIGLLLCPTNTPQ
jgi:hypothetical protein